MRKIGLDLSVAFISLLNQLIFTTSKLAEQMTEAKIPIPQDSSLKMFGLRTQNDIEQFSKYMAWHLFKGGVRTSYIDQLHNPRILEDTFKAGYKHEETSRESHLKTLVAYKEKLAAVKESGLRKAKPITSIVKEAEKIDTSSLEFTPDQSLWTFDVKEIMAELNQTENKPFLDILL